MSRNTGIFKYHEDFWVEKYRPQSLSDYLGNETIKEKFQEYIDNGLKANLLLSGDPGIGKSTFAHILVKHFDCDYKYINASDDNNVETVRTKISKFCITSGFTKLKFLVLDEFGAFTKQGQLALKSVLEQFSESTRFILTCNEIENVDEAIKSRCQHFTLIAPEKVKVRKRMLEILDKEKIEYELDEVDTIIDYNYPDLRQILNDLQKQVVGNVLKLDKEYFKLLTYQVKVVDILKSVTQENMYDKVTEIRQLMADTRIKKYTRLYRHLFENVPAIARNKQHNISLPIAIAKYMYQDKDMPDKEINLVVCLIELVEIITAQN